MATTLFVSHSASMLRQELQVRWRAFSCLSSLSHSASMLRQELQERLVEGLRIVVGHQVHDLGNGHQTTAWNTPSDNLID
jgi:hypothetical protein